MVPALAPTSSSLSMTSKVAALRKCPFSQSGLSFMHSSASASALPALLSFSSAAERLLQSNQKRTVRTG